MKLSETQTRRPVNVSISRAVLEEAKALDINVSRAAEEGMRAAVRAARAAQWLTENGDSIAQHNHYLEQHGLPLQPIWMAGGDGAV